MKHREDEKQNAEATEVLHEIKREVHEETRSERRNELVREMIEHAHDRSSASPEEMQLIVEATLEQRPNEFPSLLDICNGNIEVAASFVVRHMLDAARHRDTLVLQRALSNCEELAADIINSPAKLWLPNGE